MSKANSAVSVVVLSVAAALASSASAQEAPIAASPETGGLQEVLVTAQRRVENLQDTPISITALNGQMLADRNITSVLGFANFVPNLTVNPIMGDATAASVYIRGQGFADTESYVDSPVSTYIDGVLYPRPNIAGLELIDLAQVEVLRGPQGTLFGRNTTGGALNITTRNPSDHAGFAQTLEYGGDEELIAKTLLETGLIADSSWKAKIAYYHHYIDGWVNNLSPRGTYDAGYRDSDSVWGQLHGQVGSRLTVDIRTDYTNLAAVQPASQMVIAGADIQKYFGNSPNLGGEPFNFSPGHLSNMYLGDYGPEINKSGGMSLTANYEVEEWLSLKDIIAYRGTRSTSADNNTTGQGNLLGNVLDPVTGLVSVEPVKPFNAQEDIYQHQFSNELQFLGQTENFTYAAGLFYFEEVADENNPLFLTSVLPGGDLGVNVDVPRAFNMFTISKAAYAQATWKPPILDRKLSLTFGGRYTEDYKSIDEPGRYAGKNWNKTSFAGSLQYEWTPDLMTYFRMANAYKAGGFTPGFPGSYDPENALLYEVGVKSDWWENRLRANLTLYITDYTDQQLQETVGGIPVVTNAGKATFSGGELEVTAIPIQKLKLTASLGVIDPNYKVYLFTDPSGATINVANEVHMTYAAKTNYTLSAVYDIWQGGGGAVSASADYHYESRRWFFPLDRQLPYNEFISGPPIHDLAARVTWANFITAKNGATWSAYVFGRNLLNQIQSTTGTDWTPSDFATVVFTRPRTYGVGVDVKL